MRQFHYLLLLLASFVIITACSDDDFYVNPQLKVSKTSLEFSKTASLASVDVTKNANDEFYTRVSGDQSGGWVTITHTDSGFNVAVEENTESVNRTATITLILKKGTLPAPVTVEVRQSKDSELSLNLSEGDKHYLSLGGEVVVYLSGNFTKTGWDVSSDASWVVFDKNNLDYKFTLKVLENTDVAEREAKITVITEQGATASLNIYQEGIRTWHLPFLDLGYNLETRGYMFPRNMQYSAAFEEARGSTSIKGLFGNEFAWKTKSALLPKITYRTFTGETTIIDVLATNLSSTDFMHDPLYWEYLESEGFKLTYADEASISGGRVVFWNQKRAVSIVHDKAWGGTIYYIWSIKELHHHVTGELRPCPTFEKLPIYFADFTATLADVDAWEAEQNSKQLNRYIDYTYTPDPSEAKDVCIERVYHFKDDGTLKDTWLLFEDLELGLYQYGNMNASLATKELKVLMEANGFTIGREDDTGLNGAWFTHPDKGINVQVLVGRFPLENHLPRLVLEITPIVI